MTKTVATKPTKTAKPKLPPIVYILGGLGVLLLLPQLFKLLPVPNARSAKLRISAGEQVLITADATTQKQQGAEAVAKQDFPLAQQQFERSLAQLPNDPETVIYLNNAKAGSNPLTIAVSVPISSNLNVAQEMLRGVAQAQQRVNQQGGIAGRMLKVIIADDANDPELAQQVATELVRKAEVMAVVGHNASNASLAAAPIYQQAGLVMISPTSASDQLAGFGSAILRTLPSTNFMADPLAEYVVKTAGKPAGKTKIAFCFDVDAPDNLAFRNAFAASLTRYGGQLVPIDCEFNRPDFNPVEVLRQASSRGVQGILMTPHVDRLDKSLSLAAQNQGQIPLYSSSTMYTIKTLQVGKANIVGLTLPVVWHPQQTGNFSTQAKQLWGGTVNWRTAMAYDATQAIVTALAQTTQRQDLSKTLRDPGFMAPGASQSIQFLPSGDRQITPILVKVVPTQTGYEFTPLTDGQSATIAPPKLEPPIDPEVPQPTTP
jgi:branched-chain amino acid transport system substrate-binding protein